MKRVQEKEKKCCKKKKHYLVYKKRKVKALLIEEAVLQMYKEDLDIEENKILERDWSGTNWCQ